MDRNNLRKNLIQELAETNNVSYHEMETNYKNYQAHHIIPIEVLTEIFEVDCEDLSEDFNQTWNGILLPINGLDYSHHGSHPHYTEFVRNTLYSEIKQGKNTVMEVCQHIATVIKFTIQDNCNNDWNGTINVFEEYLYIIEKTLSDK